MWATREDKAQPLLLCVTGYLERKHTFVLDLHDPISSGPVRTGPGLNSLWTRGRDALLPPPTLPNVIERE